VSRSLRDDTFSGDTKIWAAMYSIYNTKMWTLPVSNVLNFSAGCHRLTAVDLFLTVQEFSIHYNHKNNRSRLIR
jgi:hypothetical protein